ncbi:MAG: hypothetical protein ACK6DM_02425 [Alphaproteobacteria bacterium]
MTTKTPSALVFTILSVIVGAVIGFFGFSYLFDAWESGGTVSSSDTLAVVLAVLLAGQGVMVLGLSFARRSLGAVISGEEQRSATPAQVARYRMQGAVLMLAAVLLFMPVDPTLLGFIPAPPGNTVMFAIVALLALQSLFNLRLWLGSDEFDRQMIANTSAVSFWATHIPFFLWGAGERIGVLPALGTWDLAVAIMVIYLMA